MRPFTAVLAAAISLPSPTGTSLIGTTDWHVIDRAREEPFAPGRKRDLHVIAYYPAASASAAKAPYLREGAEEATAFASLLRVSADAYGGLADIQTHAWLDAPIVPGRSKLPLLIFSHGYTAHASAYTALLEDLASHGYVVLSIVHPYEAVAARQADGTTATLLGADGALRKEIRDVFAEWATEDRVAAAITNAADDTAQLDELRKYLATLPKTTAALDRWVADFRAVVDDLHRTKDRAAPPRIVDRVDLTRVGIFGHSMGGVSAAAFCAHEQSCAAVANFDGSPQYGRLIDEKLERPVMMVYSARAGREKTNDAVYSRTASRYYKVSVAGTKHVDFSDMILWGGPLRDRGAFGTIEPDRAITLTREIARSFFDRELRKASPPFFKTEHPVSEVTVRITNR